MMRAFITGVLTFRHAFTISHDDQRLRDAFDAGRELAHRLTLRQFED